MGQCTTDVPGASAYEKGLPVPTLKPGYDYVVQLVNESKVTLLAAANAANQTGQKLSFVEPREGTWVLKPMGQPGSVLTVDIPPAWENTKCPANAGPNCTPNGPRFWARTGCRYDIAHNFAQCETGACEGPYDCGKQALKGLGTGGTAPVSIVEWTFNAVDAQGFNYPDISLVDGVSLTVDIQALGKHCAQKPGDPKEPNWLSQNQPLAIHGSDLRDPKRCMDSYQLKRGSLSTFIQGGTGNPNDVVACFTNCGRYEYGGTPPGTCTYNPTIKDQCYYWKTFCCFAPTGDPQKIYGGTCTSDQQCGQKGGCWQQPPLTGKLGPQICACRAFIKNTNCPSNVCTHPYSTVDPLGAAAQPPFGHCSDVSGDANACIGDDTVHQVFPGGYTWPNDPQTYASDARAYRIIFAPGGTTVPITDSGPIPLCSSLPAGYGFQANRQSCSGTAGKVFAGARLAPICKTNKDCPNPDIPGAFFGCNTGVTPARCSSWDCKITDGTATHGVLCRWSTSLGSPPPTPTATPTATPTPGIGADVTSTSVSNAAPPGATVTAGTVTVRNDLEVTESIGSVTISVSHPTLFSALTLSGGGQSTTVTPPTASTTFTLAKPVAVPAGGSVTFSLSGVIALHPVMLGSEFKYAGLTLTAALPISRSTWPLAGGLLMLAIALLGLPDGTRRRAIIIAVLALGVAAASAGCGGSSSGPGLVASSQQVTAVAVTAGGAPEAVEGLPAPLGKIID